MSFSRKTAILALVGPALLVPATGEAAAKTTSIQCLNKDGSDTVRKERPKECASFSASGSFGGGVNLGRLDWSGWGNSTARATGIEKGFHLPPSHIPVEVRAYRRKPACGGGKTYTRLRATSSNGSTTVKLPTC